MAPQRTLTAERLQRVSQEFLDSWCPGTGVTVDWTGTSYVVQLARGLRLAPPIWLDSGALRSLDDEIALRRELLTSAWSLAQDAHAGPIVWVPQRAARRSSPR